MEALPGGIAVQADAVEHDEDEREPSERDEPEKEILRMWRSRGRLLLLRFWEKLCPRTCIVNIGILFFSFVERCIGCMFCDVDVVYWWHLVCKWDIGTQQMLVE